ncbi:hypothetical protein OPT61_g8450 [Boeremia exigua]|uniref:Uncharacterized protein n=1 Tax=Boeremia exigua TaxID=749465 RepID=A0ACC2HZ54_9PLEO|nr:hypothetical protein OPT61_g8450 [Boeremia exigua]
MSLDRRTGLYGIPSHHLHGARLTPRPTFNSMDFEAEQARPTFNSMDFAAEQARVPNTDANTSKKVKVAKSDEWKDKKPKRQSDDGQQMSSRTPATSTPLIKVTPATTSSKGKKTKNATQSDKKRKRASSDHIPSAPTPKSGSRGFIAGNMLQNVQSSVKAAGDVFSSPHPASALGPSKKAKKDKKDRKSNDTIDFGRMAKETRAIDKKERREKKKARRQSVAAGSPGVAVPPASPPVFRSVPRKSAVPLPPSAVRAAKPSQDEREFRSVVPLPRSGDSGAANVQADGSRKSTKTPVPPPPSTFSRAATTSKADKIGRRDFRHLEMVSAAPPAHRD